MSNNSYPVLCGGTFFTLILEARKARSGKKEQLYGKRDGLSETEALAALVQVMYPEYEPPSSERTFITNTSEYKLCKNNGGNIPFFDMEIRAFDNRVKTDYQTVLMQMIDFTSRFIEVGGSVKRDEWLVKALLDLIESDQSVANNGEFYIFEDGRPATKTTIVGLDTVCLPAFLLGVWHYIIVMRPDNTVGMDTVSKWCPPNNHKTRKYSGTMGERIARPITVTNLEASYFENYETADSGGKPHSEDAATHSSAYENEDTGKTINQIVNTPAVFINHGANGIQINNTGILNIDRGEKK